MKGIVLDISDIADSREIMESKESPKIRWFIWIMLTAVCAAIIVACVFRIDEYSRVSGEIKTQEAASSVISLNNCKLKQILVEEGQTVHEGDVLFVLDSDYAESQRQLLEKQLDSYTSDLNNTELLKKSIEENANLFDNSGETAKYYYRFEQYKNGTLLSAREIDNTSLSSSLSSEEKENRLASAVSDISAKETQLSEYRSLLSCVKSNTAYHGSIDSINADYDEYSTSVQKTALLREQYQTQYENMLESYNGQGEYVTAAELENARQAAERAYTAATDHKSSYLYDIRTQILLIEDRLITDSENPELQAALSEYTALKNAVEQGTSFSPSDDSIRTSYESYIDRYNALLAEQSGSSAEYERLYAAYYSQSTGNITDSDIVNAEGAYKSAVIDEEAVKNAFIAQIQTNISALESELQALRETKISLELALKDVEDIDEYERLSSEQLKNEAIITVNSEIDSLNNSIAALETQLTEINETIKDSEIRASVDGTVTLINELSAGDLIQAGSSLCSIIPDSGELRVTLYIPENEITKIKAGQKTEYIIDAIPYSEYGRVNGEITSVSADSVSYGGEKYYIAQASLSAYSLKNKDGNVRELKTGMLVEARAVSGSKRVITWLLEKINLID